MLAPSSYLEYPLSRISLYLELKPGSYAIFLSFFEPPYCEHHSISNENFASLAHNLSFCYEIHEPSHHQKRMASEETLDSIRLLLLIIQQHTYVLQKAKATVAKSQPVAKYFKKGISVEIT